MRSAIMEVIMRGKAGMQKQVQQQGFTLLELIVVIIAIGILLTIVLLYGK